MAKKRSIWSDDEDDESLEEQLLDYVDSQILDISDDIKNDTIYEGSLQKDITEDFFKFLRKEPKKENSFFTNMKLSEKGGGKTFSACAKANTLLESDDRLRLSIFKGTDKLLKSIQKSWPFGDRIYSTSDINQVERHSIILIDEGVLATNAKRAMGDDSVDMENLLAGLRHNHQFLIVNSQWKGGFYKSIREQSDITEIGKCSSMSLFAIEDPELKAYLTRKENRVRMYWMNHEAFTLSSYKNFKKFGFIYYRLDHCPWWNDDISRNLDESHVVARIEEEQKLFNSYSLIAREFNQKFDLEKQRFGKNDLLRYFLLINNNNPNSNAYKMLNIMGNARNWKNLLAFIAADNLINKPTTISYKEWNADELTESFSQFCRSEIAKADGDPIVGKIVYEFILGTEMKLIAKRVVKTQQYVTDVLYNFRTEQEYKKDRYVGKLCPVVWFDMAQKFLAEMFGGYSEKKRGCSLPDVSAGLCVFSVKCVYDRSKSLVFYPDEDCSPEMEHINDKSVYFILFNPLWKNKWYIQKIEKNTKKISSTDKGSIHISEIMKILGK